MSFKLQLGINNCTNAEYHSDRQYLSSSKLKTLLESTQKFHEELLNPPPPMSGTHLEVGTFTHSLLHEPHLVAEEYAVFPGFRRAGKDFEAFAAINKDKKILSMSMEAQGRAYAQSVQALPHALELLKDCESELSIATMLQDVHVKARFDAINVPGGYILDTKTSREVAGKDQFKATIKEYRYDLSAALYAAVAEAYYGKPFDFYWLVIAKTDPSEARLYKASEQTLAKGRTDVSIALEKYKACMTSGNWADRVASNSKQEMVEEI